MMQDRNEQTESDDLEKATKTKRIFTMRERDSTGPQEEGKILLAYSRSSVKSTDSDMVNFHILCTV